MKMLYALLAVTKCRWGDTCIFTVITKADSGEGGGVEDLKDNFLIFLNICEIVKDLIVK